MYLMYVDESGDTGLINSPTPYYITLCPINHRSARDTVIFGCNLSLKTLASETRLFLILSKL